ncbi:MAG: hypothetical protein ACFB5Z_20945 [Elainellaceae cyanobacterium]
MKRITLAALSIFTFAIVASPISALKANAQLFEGTPPENADPAVTDSDTTDPNYDAAETDDTTVEADLEMDEAEMDSEMDADMTEMEDAKPAGGEAVSEEFDGEFDGEGLSPEFEEENRETLNNG